MDISELEENLFAACDAKLHGGMCKTLSAIYCKVLSIFPSLEDARPRSRSGIQALCSLHIALEKAKTVLQHCSECSKLYLAITGDSVLSKFEKARSALKDSLKRVEDIVPQSIGCQIEEILSEIEGAEFSLDQSEKQVGDEIIALLQQGRKFDSSIDCTELESFHQAATKLGITSSRAALTERRALKKLIERARVEEDKRKESIVAYLLHLMRKYSKLFRSSEVSDDNDSQCSTPCSPTIQGSAEDNMLGGNGHVFERQLSKLSSFNFKPNIRRSGQMPVAPEELRCPISLQIMFDPVIISSGQTYERICIEKWLSDGHNTCPKTQQQLSHTGLTPNYCVKGLIASWCEQNGVPAPSGPPESLDLNYWRLALSECESTKSKSMDSVRSCKSKGVKVVPLEESCIKEETEEHGRENVSENVSVNEEDSEINVLERYKRYLAVLNEEECLNRKCKIVEKIRLQLKDDEEARISMGAQGFVEALFRFLDSAFNEGNSSAQDVGAMALFNLAVNNNRNKEMMLAAGVIPLLEKMISTTNFHGSATALYLNLSCFEEAKPIIGSSQAVPFLVQQLQAEKTEPLCKLDSLHALFHLSTHPPNVPKLLAAGIISGLLSILPTWTEKCIAVFINLATNESGKHEMSSNSSLISGLATILDSGEPSEQEQAVSCLLILCNRNEKCCQMVLQEGVIPGLVSVSVNGTARGKEKAQKLLMLFREQRQRDQSQSQSQSEPEPEPEPVETCHQAETCHQVNMIPKSGREPKHINSKSISRKTMGKAFSFLWKSKSHSSLKSYS